MLRTNLALAYLVGTTVVALGQTLTVMSPAQVTVSKRLSQGNDQGQGKGRDHKKLPPPDNNAPTSQPDGALQTQLGPLIGAISGANFDGVGASSVAPSDANMAVGQNPSYNYIFQTVNSRYAIYTKSGALVVGPNSLSSLWSPLGNGNGCATNNGGDVVAQYDKLADRWIITQLGGTSGPFSECIAISQTADPTGVYYLYSYSYGTTLNDYPKFGVWPTASNGAYVASYNLFGNNGNTFTGGQLCAYDRTKMLVGDPSAQAICFTVSGDPSYLPADLDGSTPPLNGTPALFMNFPTTSSLRMYSLAPNFANPNASILSHLTPDLAVTPFSLACGGGTCIPQSGTTTQLDSLGDRLMYRLAFRNFGDHEAMVVNHSVTSGTSVGERWYELRAPVSTTPTFSVFQQGTYAPDATFRWMGSAAMDAAGDIALGYSASSSTIHPAIRYTGRVPSDPAGTMESEASIVEGAGSQTGGLDRWGDYSALRIDPADDCTFWYTTQYQNTNGSFNWRTRIGSFKFTSCGSQVVAPTFNPPGGSYSSAQPVAISTTTVGASIRYTTDGSTPTSSVGTVYVSPVSVSSSLTLKAIAYKAGMTDSLVASAAYVINSASNWYNLSWSNRKAITIDHTKVSGASNLTNFPMLFSVTDANLRTVANGGSVGKTDGTDILFTDSNSIKINHELESYNPATGQVLAWVQVPLVSPTADTAIYIYYGNAAAADQQNKTGVWDSNFKAVWHLANGTTLSTADSTANANDGTNSGVTANAGWIDGGGSFNGSTAFATIPASGFPAFPASGNNSSAYTLTFSTWFKTTVGGVILGQDSGTTPSASPNGWVPGIYLDNSGHLRSSLFWHGAVGTNLSPGTYNDGAWHQVVVSSNNGTETLYVDGAAVSSQTALIENGYSASYLYLLGTGFGQNWPGVPGGWFYFNGALDEMRLSANVRSSDWILTEFRNQNVPGTFFASGAQESSGGGSQVVAPTFNPPGGSYSSAQPVAISTTTVGASIRYTTDGSTPTSSVGTVYVSPVSVSSSLTLKAIAYKAGMTDSLVASAAYVINSASNWYNLSWSNRKAITIDHTKVSGASNLTSFPMLFSVTDANLRTVANGGSVGKTDGTDILFTDSNSIKINHELESYNPATGQVLAWVQVPSVSPTADTAIYIYYGNAAAADQQNKTGVWDSNFKAVWHLANGTTLSTADSTANANDGTNSGVTANAGWIDGGGSFNGSTAFATIPASGFPAFPASGNNSSAYTLTFSTWFKTTVGGVILGQDSGTTPSASPNGWVPAIYLDNSGHLRSSLFWHGAVGTNLSPGTYNDGAWHQVVVSSNNGTETLYVDGAAVSSQTALIENGYSASYLYLLGTGFGQNWPGVPGGWFYFNGALDEMRLSANVRSSDWILTEFRNQNVPGTFFASGAQESSGGGSQVVAPTFNPPGGSYSSAQPVAISTTTVGASIRYTTDGSTPTSSVGTVYVSPVSVSSSLTLKAIAYKAGMTDSLVASAAYVINSASNWYNLSWSNRKAITIDHTKVSGASNLTNFPMLFSVTDANLRTVANGGSVGKTDGTDILFTDSNSIKINHELESYNPATGQVLAWVQVPSVSPTADTAIYIYYGNAAAADQQNKTGVWDSNFKAVWHLANGTTLSTADSTANANDGTNSGVTANAGWIDGGGSFNGSTAFATIPASGFPAFPASGNNSSAYTLTFSTWFKTTVGGVILGQDSGTTPSASPNGWVPGIYLDNSGHLRSSLFWHGAVGTNLSPGTYNDGAWHQVVVSSNNGTETLYVDGAAVSSQTALIENGYSASYLYLLGTGFGQNWPGVPGGWFYFNGALDEMRLSANVRSSDWILTEFRNQNAPGTFIGVGPQQ